MEAIKELNRLPDTNSEDIHEKKFSILELVRRWGGSTTDAILDPTTQFFRTPDIEGFIGYRAEKNCVVTFGDPICAPTDKAPLAQAFHRFAEKEGKSIVYVAASPTFARWAIQNICSTLIKFGDELLLDPSCNPRKQTGTYASLLRRKTKQAAREGVVVNEYLITNPTLEHAIEQVGKAWLAGRSGPQIHISNVYLFEDRVGKRWFYAKRGDSIIGVITLNQLQAHQGWLINHLMVTPDAPNGTSELLVVTALEALEKEGCHFATVGMVTATELDEIIGLSKFSIWLARKLFGLAKKIAHLEGLNIFWGKFNPSSQPSYLLFSRKRIGLREIIALKRALYGKA